MKWGSALVASKCLCYWHALLLQGKREARFSFDGLLLPKSMDLPTTLGLHHHGDDPEVHRRVVGMSGSVCLEEFLCSS